MMDNEEFQREERYIVIKIADLKYISVENKLRSVLKDAGIKTRECVVVEADWPEYEPVWRMIQDRIEGKPNTIATLQSENAAKDERIKRLESALAAEREACARVCDSYSDGLEFVGEDEYQTGRNIAAIDIATSIRNRAADKPKGA